MSSVSCLSSRTRARRGLGMVSGDPPLSRVLMSSRVPPVHTEECPPSVRRATGLRPECPAQDPERRAHWEFTYSAG